VDSIPLEAHRDSPLPVSAQDMSAQDHLSAQDRFC
jgi:hypothetical protein